MIHDQSLRDDEYDGPGQYSLITQNIYNGPYYSKCLAHKHFHPIMGYASKITNAETLVQNWPHLSLEKSIFKTPQPSSPETLALHTSVS